MQDKSKVLIIVPHQDDEINLAGNILRTLVRNNDVYVIFSSLDVHVERGKTRKEEAINSLATYGIDVNKIEFFAFPDTPNEKASHFYSQNENIVVKRFEEYIVKLLPTWIIATDFDFHSDHRMCSLAFETAMGNILKSKGDYRPVILKGFCYDTAFYGPEDFTAYNNKRTAVKNELLANPSFEWEDRISIFGENIDGFMVFRPEYKALRMHKSQYAILHAKSIINADNVFWQRRSDNLAYSAKIEAGGNDYERLRDFKMVDTTDIRTIDPREIDYSKGIWNFDEDTCSICYRWEHKVLIDRINLYGNLNCNHMEDVDITILVNDSITIKCSAIREFARKTALTFSPIKTDYLKIIIVKGNQFSGLSEIELLYGEQKLDNCYCKVKQTPRGSAYRDTIAKRVICAVDQLIYSVAVIETKVVRKMKKIFRVAES